MPRLTLEQELSLRVFSSDVERMSEAQAKEFLLFLYRQYLEQQTSYKKLIKKEWGL